VKDLEGRVAVVTGGGSGIGRALAHAAGAAGMKVVVADLDHDAAEQVAGELRDRDVSALATLTDVSRRDAIETLAEKTWAEFGGCHLLFNNAGLLVIGPLDDRKDSEWQRAIDVNLMGVVNGVQAFVPRMKSQGGEAHIVNTASMSGLMPSPSMGVYVTTKYAVVGLSESLRADLAPHGIGVTALCPGGVKTHLIGTALRDAGSEEAAKKRIRHLTEVASLTTETADDLLDPSEVAEAAFAGVRENRGFVVTHAHLYRRLVEERHRELLRAFDAAQEPASGSATRR
jgi:NAD(P)-dependent dehydrogenase (short-subunit alcohol dehydrogenase family)